MLEGREGWVTVPIPSYLIVHPRGVALFDSGLHVDSQSDSLGYLGEFLHQYHGFDFHSGEEVSARLASMDVDPARVNYVINSHLHFDHAGGNAQIPNADVVIQAREWSHAHADGRDRKGYVAKDFDTGQPIKQVEGEHDLFGDGAVVCFPTYGHTPGHQSLRVRTDSGGEFVLCGDACYLRESLQNMHAPGIIADREAVLDVFRRFREMEHRGARIMYGHDPDFWKNVPQAPVRLG
jgi:N-acyl homoserine lactone hydrolase